jgi:hypothetical protein
MRASFGGLGRRRFATAALGCRVPLPSVAVAVSAAVTAVGRSLCEHRIRRSTAAWLCRHAARSGRSRQDTRGCCCPASLVSGRVRTRLLASGQLCKSSFWAVPR